MDKIMCRLVPPVLLALGLLIGSAKAQFNNQKLGFWSNPVASGFTGPGNVVTGARFYIGLKAYNGAYATGSNTAVTITAHAGTNSGNSQNIVILANGSVDIATANTFVGIDATASCTLAATTATCASGSSTPHVGSTITGTALAKPCVVNSVTGTFPTFTMSVGKAGTGSSCGTVSVAETFTMQYGIFISGATDQTGGGQNCTNATTTTQPQLLPDDGSGSPGIFLYPNGSSASFLSCTLTGTIAQPLTTVAVANRFANFANNDEYFFDGGTYALGGWTANLTFQYAGGGGPFTAAATDGAQHSVIMIFSGSPATVVDGTPTSTVPGTGAIATGISIGRTGFTYVGSLKMFGIWPSAFNSTQYGAMNTLISGF